jgi:hypothetical protein
MNNAITELIGQRERRLEQLDNCTYATFHYMNKAQAMGQLDYESKRKELRLKAQLVDRVIWEHIKGFMSFGRMSEAKEVVDAMISDRNK